MLHTDLRLGSRFRFFGQLKSGIEVNRTGGPRPADEDLLDVYQAFIDVGLWRSGEDVLTLRVGRQEMAFGSSRLVSFREGPNVRQSFDGARLTMNKAGWQVDTFATKPAETARGIFDDRQITRARSGVSTVFAPFPCFLRDTSISTISGWTASVQRSMPVQDVSNDCPSKIFRWACNH